MWVLGKFSHIQREQYETFEDDDGKRSNVELTLRVKTIMEFQAEGVSSTLIKVEIAKNIYL